MNIPTESHPLKPFLPEGARLLMLGSFPPKRERWSMEFFYPNWINDMWRIWGHIFFKDRHHFDIVAQKRFDKERVVAFCHTQGIALYDAACEVRRLRDNASDKFLDVVSPTDIVALIGALTHCKAIVTTGEKATDTIVEQFACPKPKVGECVAIVVGGRTLHFWRMPSSSRAYPMSLERKAQTYEKMLRAEGVL
jgi:G:T/U-mismatch repair DNA glycosylase